MFGFRWYKFIDGTHRKQAVQMDDRVKQVSGTLIIREAKVINKNIKYNQITFTITYTEQYRTYL